MVITVSVTREETHLPAVAFYERVVKPSLAHAEEMIKQYPNEPVDITLEIR